MVWVGEVEDRGVGIVGNCVREFICWSDNFVKNSNFMGVCGIFVWFKGVYDVIFVIYVVDEVVVIVFVEFWEEILCIFVYMF